MRHGNCRNCGEPYTASRMATKKAFCGESCRRAYWLRVRPPIGPLRWRPDELKFLHENFKRLGAKACAKALGRGHYGVALKARLIGAPSNKWSTKEIEYLRENYQCLGAEGCAQNLGRHASAVIMKASQVRAPAKPRVHEPRPTMRTKLLISLSARNNGCTSADVLSSSTRREVSRARREVAHTLRSSGKSYSWIGEQLGMDHTSVLAAVRVYQEMQREPAE
jgi:hypothetical protein